MSDAEKGKNGDLELLRKSLLALRARLRNDLDQLKDEALPATHGEHNGNLSNVPIHLADLGSESFDQELTLGVIENEQETLAEIEAALMRIESGTFGICENCQKPVGRPRLQAIPYTRHCIDCARDLEKQG